MLKIMQGRSDTTGKPCIYQATPIRIKQAD